MWGRLVGRGQQGLLIPWREATTSGKAGWSRFSRDLVRWVTIALPIGVVAGVGAVVFYAMWLGATDLFLQDLVGISYPLAGGSASTTVVWTSSFPRILLLPAVMAAGGLGVGFLAEKVAPEVQGHGTDDAIRAFHRQRGRIRARVPILKMIASAVTLGTGGSGGREGPVAQIGSGFGSWWASVLHLSDKERRIALATGLGAGVGAIFRAPLGGAIYSAEIFYTGDFEPEVFVPAIIASVVSYSIYGAVYGFGTLFTTPAGLSWTVEQVPLYALLGLVCAGAGIAFTGLFQRTHRSFQAWDLRVGYKVAFGAFAAGALVLLVYFVFPYNDHFAALSSINVGYGFVQAAMLGQGGLATFAPLVLLTVGVAIVLRMVSTSFTVGSGGAAGLFGTSVVVGAFLGAVVGGFFHWAVPGLVSTPDIAAFVIVGMMAFFGGISKAPLAVLVMVVEMAGGYELLLPAMLAIFLAYAATGRSHIYEEQVATRLQSPAHHDEIREVIFSELPVVAMTKSDISVLAPGATVHEGLEAASLTHQHLFPVVDGDSWVGFVTVADLLKVPESDRRAQHVAQSMRPFEVLVSENVSVNEALAKMEGAHAQAAGVVGPGSPVRVRGVVTRIGLAQARASSRGPQPQGVGPPVEKE